MVVVERLSNVPDFILLDAEILLDMRHKVFKVARIRLVRANVLRSVNGREIDVFKRSGKGARERGIIDVREGGESERPKSAERLE